MQSPIMCHAMARPKLPPQDQKSKRMIVRLTPIEHAQAQLAADQAGIGISEFARRRLMGVRLPASPTEEKLNADAVAALNRIGINLNQIAKRINSGGGVNVGKIMDALERIDAEMDRLNEPD